MDRQADGEKYFKMGYNCAQSVVLAFKDILGIDEKTAVTLVSGFGGGFGRMREVCGAVSGMTAVLSALEGYCDPGNDTAKMELYKKVQALMKEFKEINGSYICHELLSLSEGASSPVPEKRTDAYYKKRPCAELVGCACSLLQKHLDK